MLETLSYENSFTVSHHVIPNAAKKPYDAASYKNHHRDASTQNPSE
jgi:hypothetical protein